MTFPGASGRGSAAGAHDEASAVTGRYALFFSGREVGEERFRLERTADGWLITGAQELVAPHPFPNRQEYRVTLTPEWRPISLEVHWHVAGRSLIATHRADGPMWRVRVEYAGHVKEQEGDFPAVCEVEYGTHLFNTVILARRDFALGGEHEFPVLRIGPPYMAVSPDRMLYRCVERRAFEAPWGRVEAKRYVVTIPERGEHDGYTFWADEDGFVLESYEGIEPSRPWMRLVELHRHTPA